MMRDLQQSRHVGKSPLVSSACGPKAITTLGVLLSLGLFNCSADSTTAGTVSGGGAGAGGSAMASAGSAGTAGSTTAGQGGSSGAATGGSGGSMNAMAGSAGVGGSGGNGSAGGGGAAGTAGSGGAAGAAGADSGACNNPNWKFCDDFEKYAVGTVPDGDWVESPNNGALDMQDKTGASIDVTTDKKVSGAKSVHFWVKTQGRSFLDTETPFPMTPNSFYGRMMIWLDQVPTTPEPHWDVVTAFGVGGPEDKDYRWGGQNGKTIANHQPGDELVSFGDSVPPEKQWICYEWKFDEPTTTLEMWMDDYEMTGDSHLSLSVGWSAPQPFTTVQIGWGHYKQIEDADVWIDDVVIDDERIGCPPRASVP